MTQTAEVEHTLVDDSLSRNSLAVLQLRDEIIDGDFPDKIDY